MVRYGQLVMGPAGSGKSTYCSTMQRHAQEIGRNVHVVNLDPAAEHFDYPVLADIRDLISVSDAMEDEILRFGPNGGLVFCMEYLVQNFEWLEEHLGDYEDDYILFDCPGQVELYTHNPAMGQLVQQLQKWNFTICGIFVIDSQFMLEASKLVSGVMSTLSAMSSMNMPHINIMTKVDLLNDKAKKDLDKFLKPHMESLFAEEFDGTQFGEKYKKLNEAIASVIDSYSMVQYMPMDITDEDTIHDILMEIDTAIQYGEDLEPKMKDNDLEDEDNDDDHYDD